MTLDELVFVLERLDKAGCTKEQLVAAARAARDWRVGRKALLAVKRALAPVESDLAANADMASSPLSSGTEGAGAQPRAATESVFSGQQVDTESGFGADPHPDSRKATARKALLMTSRLKPCARRVGAVLLDRYNLTTGRCDAAVRTLADDAGYDLRSARRAIGELCKAGLFGRALQVGRGHANSYSPRWDALADLAAEAEALIADSENRTLGQKPDGRVRQNLKRESTSDFSGGGQLSLRMFSPIEGGLDAGRREALVRVEMALRGKHREHEARRTYLAALTELPASALEAIADAERAQRGDGLRAFEAWLRAQKSGWASGPQGTEGQSADATGPPTASGTG